MPASHSDILKVIRDSIFEPIKDNNGGKVNNKTEEAFEQIYGRKPGHKSSKPYKIEDDNRWQGFKTGVQWERERDSKTKNLSLFRELCKANTQIEKLQEENTKLKDQLVTQESWKKQETSLLDKVNKLQTQLAEAGKVIEFYGDKENWDTSLEGYGACINGDPYDLGKRARAYQKKWDTEGK